MPDYRRWRVPGGTYFFTINLLERRSDLRAQHIDAMRAAVRRTRHERPFRIDAWVVLPEHLHCILTLPEGATTSPTASKRSRSASCGPFPPPSGARGCPSPAGKTPLSLTPLSRYSNRSLGWRAFSSLVPVFVSNSGLTQDLADQPCADVPTAVRARYPDFLRAELHELVSLTGVWARVP